MNKNSKETSFLALLQTKNLSEIVESMLELSVDSFLKDGILKDLPIFSMVSGVYKTTLKIRDNLFFRKVALFLDEIGKVEFEKRQRMISKLNTDAKFNQRVGETVIMLLDRLDNFDKARLVGKAFRIYCEEKIDSNQLQLCNRIIERAYIPHFEYLSSFIHDNKNSGNTKSEVLQTFLDCGLAWSPANYSTTNEKRN
jgi:hypothetical protein